MKVLSFILLQEVQFSLNCYVQQVTDQHGVGSLTLMIHSGVEPYSFLEN